MPDPELKQGASVGVEGYLWIGSMAVGAKTLSPQNLSGVADPSQVAVGQQLKVLANLSLRQSPPSEIGCGKSGRSPDGPGGPAGSGGAGATGRGGVGGAAGSAAGAGGATGNLEPVIITPTADGRGSSGVP